MKNLLNVYDLAGNLLATLNDNSEYQAYSIQEDQKLNEIWTLNFKIFRDSPKMKYIINENIIQYKGEEYFIKVPDLQKSDSRGIVTVNCRHTVSICESQINEELDLVGVDATTMMNTVLTSDGGSGWSIGTISVDSLYRPLQSKELTRFSNLVKIAETYDAFLIYHSSSKTIDLIKNYPDRQIYIKSKRNLKGIDLKYSSEEMVTKLYVRGGAASTTGNDISIVNIPAETDSDGIVHEDGKSYITCYKYFLDMKNGDGSQKYTQDYINAHPEKFKREQILTLSDYIDEQVLYAEAKSRLKLRYKPKVTCDIDMLNFSKYPEYCGTLVTLEPILGEYIWVMDLDINEIIQAQVISKSQNSDNLMALKVSLANFIEYSSLAQQLIDSSNKVKTSFDKLGYAKGSYIKGVLDTLNVQLGSTQSNYQGVNCDKNGNLFIEDTTKTHAIKLGGGIFGIGSRTTQERDAGTDYTYTAFGTFEGFTANEIITGVLKGGKVNFDLENGTLLIGDSPTSYQLYFDGTNLKFGSNVTMSWSQISSKPSIPQNAGDIGALPTNWVGTTYIDSDGVYTGKIIAGQIYGDTITGKLLKTSDTDNYVTIQNQYVDVWKNANRKAQLGFNGVNAPSLRFWDENNLQLDMYGLSGQMWMAQPLTVVGAISCQSGGAFNNTLSEFGYQTLPGGFLMQWGSVYIGNNIGTGWFEVQINFPYTFTAIYNVSATMLQNWDERGNTHDLSVSENPSTGFFKIEINRNQAQLGNGIFWFAIGHA